MITTILDQHTEEAAFLAGLQIAGLKGLHQLLEQLNPHAQGEVFATTALALRLGNESALETLHQHLQEHPEGEAYLVAALGWLEWHEISASYWAPLDRSALFLSHRKQRHLVARPREIQPA